MNQVLAVFIAFSLIPILLRLKLRLNYVLLISTVVLSIFSGFGIKEVGQALGSLFIDPSSLDTILTVLMVAVLSGLMKHYEVLNKIILTMMLLFRDKRKVLALTPALMGTLILPGGALLSAPFVNEIGNEMDLKPSRRAAINLVFRHVAIFLLPYSTSLLVVKATIPEIQISKIILLSLSFVIGSTFLGYFFFLRDIKVEKAPPAKNIMQNILRLFIYTSPIYLCLIINVITGLPLYITLWGSIFLVYLLGNKKDFFQVLLNTINKGTLLTILTVSIILVMKELILKMDGLFFVLQNIIATGSNSQLSIILFLFMSSFIIGYIIGLHSSTLAIVLPFLYKFGLNPSELYVYTFFVVGAGFLGYFFSPLHLCQAFTLEHMNVTTKELYKEYKYYAPALFLILAAIMVIYQLSFL